MPAESIDLWLLELFGWSKSLEEIDRMDYARLLRALDVRNVRDTERMRRRYLDIDSPLPVDEQDPDVWAAILENDRLLLAGESAE